MRATEIIRGVLDLIDQVECAQQEQPADPVGGAFAQLFAQMTEPSLEPQGYDNSPDPHVQGIDSVTTAAGLGGLNGPKNPSDIRSDSVSMYPNFQTKE
jgi:hypothetical protein